MSAPKEIYQIVDDRDPVGECAYYDKDLSWIPHVTTTRYIRADLVAAIIKAGDAAIISHKLQWGLTSESNAWDAAVVAVVEIKGTE
jgi:hypothetical protein